MRSGHTTPGHGDEIVAVGIIAIRHFRMDVAHGLPSMDLMATRLYESAWVRIEGSEQPHQVRRDRRNAGAFHIGGHAYDIRWAAIPAFRYRAGDRYGAELAGR